VYTQYLWPISPMQCFYRPGYRYQLSAASLLRHRILVVPKVSLSVWHYWRPAIIRDPAFIRTRTAEPRRY